MLNHITLMGRLTRDVELRSTASGVSVAGFTLAVDRDLTNKQTGERDTDFIDIVAWRGNADVVERFVKKGTQIFIEGRIRTRSWDDQAGNKRYTTEIIADNLQLLGKKSDNPGGQPGGYQAPAQQQYNQPAQTYAQPAQQTYAPQQAAVQNVVNDIPDDDLPF